MRNCRMQGNTTIEFIITKTSFQYLGEENELVAWQADKYQAWYEMPWQCREVIQSTQLSE